MVNLYTMMFRPKMIEKLFSGALNDNQTKNNIH